MEIYSIPHLDRLRLSSMSLVDKQVWLDLLSQAARHEPVYVSACVMILLGRAPICLAKSPNSPDSGPKPSYLPSTSQTSFLTSPDCMIAKKPLLGPEALLVSFHLTFHTYPAPAPQQAAPRNLCLPYAGSLMALTNCPIPTVLITTPTHRRCTPLTCSRGTPLTCSRTTTQAVCMAAWFRSNPASKRVMNASTSQQGRLTLWHNLPQVTVTHMRTIRCPLACKALSHCAFHVISFNSRKEKACGLRMAISSTIQA